ncbi:MAG TPA: hypothetical protein VI138_00615 [Candidatus Dormibacteraeota bacterium]
MFASLVVLAFVFAGVATAAFYFGDSYALGGLNVRRVTPQQLADAMHGDDFYSNYREDTLLIRGSIASVSGDGSHLTLEFSTSGTFKALCRLQRNVPGIHVGQRIIVVSEADTAEREPSAIVLPGCTFLGAP